MLSLNMREKNPKLKQITLGMAWTILALWSLYPFVWLFSSHGINVLSDVGEAGAFLILDLTTKIGFSVLLLYYLAEEAQTTFLTHERI